MAEEGAGAGAVPGEVIRAGRLVAALAVLAVAGCAAVAPPPRTGEGPMGVCGQTTGPQVAVDRTFLVFFGPDSAEVSPRAKQILQELAGDRATYGNGDVIGIFGHVDAAEARHTHTLDLRRADAVRTTLVADGFPAHLLALMLLGADHPLVPSDKAEPQNRYVSFSPIGFGETARQQAQSACRAWTIRSACFASNPTASLEACEKVLKYYLPPE